jgi:hypothetical protein
MSRLLIKKSILIGLSLLVAAPSMAQTSSGVSKRAMFEEYQEFRRQCTKEYIEFVRQAWREYQGEPAVPPPADNSITPYAEPLEENEMPKLIDDETNAFKLFGSAKDKITEKHKKKQKENPVKAGKVMTLPKTEPQAKPIYPILEVKDPKASKEAKKGKKGARSKGAVEEEATANTREFDFTKFGTKFKIRIVDNDTYKVKSIQENDVADALQILSDKQYDNTIYDCLMMRKEHQLSDWAYFQMVKEFADQIYGKETSESTLLTAYICTESGYKVKLARNEQKLILLLATDHMLYNRVSFNVDGQRFFPVSEYSREGGLYICNASFPKDQGVSFRLPKNHLFDYAQSEVRTIKTPIYPEMNFTIHSNKNLINFYDTYLPNYLNNDIMTRWAMYANTPMSIEMREELYPQIQKVIKGMNQFDAVTRLLNWIQVGFEYRYDNDVWGHDRAFFAEETLFYPYCDCEDRAILFTRLVRDLLHMKTVLVFYPNHLASAVRFDEEVGGDCIIVGKEKYTICDPTFKYAGIGRTMPKMNNATAGIIPLE